MKYKHMQYNFLWKPKKSKHRKISNSLFVGHLLKRRLADGNHGRLTHTKNSALSIRDRNN